MIKEKINDVEVTYLYVKEFKWLDAQMGIDLAGHPAQGRVYRSIFNKNDNTHKLSIDANNFIYIDELVSDGSEKAYKAKIAELTPKTILEFDILKEDLEKVIEWIKSDNQDIKDFYNTEKEASIIPIKSIIESALSSNKEDMEFLNLVKESLTKLNTLNSIQAKIIVELTDQLTDEALEFEDLFPLNLNPKYASGININTALEAMRRYTSADKRTNEDRDDLFIAIRALVKELEQRILNELD